MIKWSERDRSTWTLLRIIGITVISLALWAIFTTSPIPAVAPDQIQKAIASSGQRIAEAATSQEVGQP